LIKQSYKAVKANQLHFYPLIRSQNMILKVECICVCRSSYTCIKYIRFPHLDYPTIAMKVSLKKKGERNQCHPFVQVISHQYMWSEPSLGNYSSFLVQLFVIASFRLLRKMVGCAKPIVGSGHVILCFSRKRLSSAKRRLSFALLTKWKNQAGLIVCKCWMQHQSFISTGVCTNGICRAFFLASLLI